MNLSKKEGFAAMFLFLEKYYDLTKGDDLAILLGGLDCTIFLGDGPADPGAWDYWLEFTAKITHKNKADDFVLSEKEAFDAVILFLQEHGNKIKSQEIASLLEYMEKNHDETIKNWQESVTTVSA